jgi:hypothetical protein
LTSARSARHRRFSPRGVARLKQAVRRKHTIRHHRAAKQNNQHQVRGTGTHGPRPH